MTRALITAILAAVALALFGGQALAQEREKPTPRTTSARLEVDGAGNVLLRGRFVVFGALASRSLLVVTDRAGDGELTIDGEPIALRKRKEKRLRRAQGRVYIAGRNMVVRVRSKDLTLSVAGRGRALLRGVGAFRLNDGPSFEWDRRVIRIHPLTPSNLGRTDGNEPTPTRRAPRRVAATAESSGI
jgi:hypothetical protein